MIKYELSARVATSSGHGVVTEAFPLLMEGGGHSQLVMMFHFKPCDVEVIAVADLQSEAGGRPREAVGR